MAEQVSLNDGMDVDTKPNGMDVDPKPDDIPTVVTLTKDAIDQVVNEKSIKKTKIEFAKLLGTEYYSEYVMADDGSRQKDALHKRVVHALAVVVSNTNPRMHSIGGFLWNAHNPLDNLLNALGLNDAESVYKAVRAHPVLGLLFFAKSKILLQVDPFLREKRTPQECDAFMEHVLQCLLGCLPGTSMPTPRAPQFDPSIKMIEDAISDYDTWVGKGKPPGEPFGNDTLAVLLQALLHRVVPSAVFESYQSRSALQIGLESSLDDCRLALDDILREVNDLLDKKKEAFEKKRLEAATKAASPGKEAEDKSHGETEKQKLAREAKEEKERQAHQRKLDTRAKKLEKASSDKEREFLEIAFREDDDLDRKRKESKQRLKDEMSALDKERSAGGAKKTQSTPPGDSTRIGLPVCDQLGGLVFDLHAIISGDPLPTEASWVAGSDFLIKSEMSGIPKGLDVARAALAMLRGKTFACGPVDEHDNYTTVAVDPSKSFDRLITSVQLDPNVYKDDLTPSPAATTPVKPPCGGAKPSPCGGAKPSPPPSDGAKPLTNGGATASSNDHVEVDGAGAEAGGDITMAEPKKKKRKKGKAKEGTTTTGGQ